MKKVTALCLAGLLLLLCCACSPTTTTTPSNDNTSTQTPDPTPGQTPDQTPDTTPDEGGESTPVPTTEEKPGAMVRPDTAAVVVRNEVFSEDFESAGVGDFHARGPETVAITDEQSYEGEYAMAITGRSATWHGAQIDLSDRMKAGSSYEISAWIRYEGEPASARIAAKYTANGSNYRDFATVTAKKGEWIQMQGLMDVPGDTESIAPYFETDYSNEATGSLDIYIDNIIITEVTVELDITAFPSIHEQYDDYFSIGMGTGSSDFAIAGRALTLTHHFDSITMGNEMKPDSLLDIGKCASDPTLYYTEPALRLQNMDSGLQFARDNGLGMRGHTLVWHSQTPKAFFTEDYTPGGALVSAEVMDKRMESYIKQVLEYAQTNYPGVVYAWDVVNEAIEPGDNTPGNIRKSDSMWYEVMGTSYVEAAFTYARKYAAPEVKLFYNDYNEWETIKSSRIMELCKDLYEKGILDGIGMQAHIGVSNPTTFQYQEALIKYGQVGCEIQITELDIGQSDNSEKGLMDLAQRYKRFMNMLCFEKDNGLNITNVTVWGLTDDQSWLLKDGPRYPLLFDSYLMPKEAFWGFIRDEAV